MDSLTARIAALTRAIKACGVFDGSIPEIARLLQEGMENKLLATDNWAGLSQKGGLVGAISLLPIKEFADALTALIAARAVVKQDLYEISGTSDIMRGATNPNETLGAQKLKGQFSGVRLTDRRDEFNRFVRDTLGIMAEIICEFFSRETIRRMSDFDQWAAEQDLKAWALQRFPPAPPPMMGHNGGPPLDPAMSGAMMPPPPAANVNPQQPNAVAPDISAQSQQAAPPPEPMPSGARTATRRAPSLLPDRCRDRQHHPDGHGGGEATADRIHHRNHAVPGAGWRNGHDYAAIDAGFRKNAAFWCTRL
jgi:hypothetical protein